MHRDTTLGSYPDFLRTLLDRDYNFIFFHDLSRSEGQVILRHDIDFDIGAALEMARTEAATGVKATYFFLLSNESYNPLSRENQDRIAEIRSLGHRVSLHFDPTVYDDFVGGLERERDCFAAMLGSEVDIVSLHRPSPYFLEHDAPIAGCDHTYRSRYFRDIKYVSDSGGTFSYGHPFETEAFREGKSLQLLIHPIWWTGEGADQHDKLKSFYARNKEQLKKHYSLNCKPFKEIIDDLD